MRLQRWTIAHTFILKASDQFSLEWYTRLEDLVSVCGYSVEIGERLGGKVNGKCLPTASIRTEGTLGEL